MPPSDQPLVALLMGSDSDLPALRPCLEVLDEFGIPYEARVLSAHRSPERTRAFVLRAEERGIKVLIAAAGGAAHLAGAVAANTPLPVIGVPVDSGALQGLDALLSTVQMPPGIPVATVAIGKMGARNAGLLAIQIMGVGDLELREKMRAFKVDMDRSVAGKDEKLQASLRQGGSAC